MLRPDSQSLVFRQRPHRPGRAVSRIHKRGESPCSAHDLAVLCRDLASSRNRLVSKISRNISQTRHDARTRRDSSPMEPVGWHGASGTPRYARGRTDGRAMAADREVLPRTAARSSGAKAKRCAPRHERHPLDPAYRRTVERTARPIPAVPNLPPALQELDAKRRSGPRARFARPSPATVESGQTARNDRRTSRRGRAPLRNGATRTLLATANLPGAALSILRAPALPREIAGNGNGGQDRPIRMNVSPARWDDPRSRFHIPP